MNDKMIGKTISHYKIIEKPAGRQGSVAADLPAEAFI
jgi:hypothetical protein